MELLEQWWYLLTTIIVTRFMIFFVYVGRWRKDEASLISSAKLVRDH